MLRTIATTFTFKLLFLFSLGISATTAWALRDAQAEFRTLQGSYMMYSLGLGDPQPPKASDSKIAFAIKGEAARDMFDSMAPDVRDVCTAGTSVRARTKGHVTCQREQPGDYRCSFGFDLQTGKSIGGSVC